MKMRGLGLETFAKDLDSEDPRANCIELVKLSESDYS
jgi:hypothetical protein